MKKLLIALLFSTIFTAALFAQSSANTPTITPAELAAVLQNKALPQPVILQVGFHTLYQQAHIPGSDYVGPTSDPSGVDKLRARVKSLSKQQAIVLYCGCCPWDKCPNIRPAAEELRKLGFTNVKLLDIPKNFGSDWVDKGYPTTKGQ